MWLLTASAATAADCPEGQVSDLDDTVDAAQHAYASGEFDAFAAGVEAVRGDLPCVAAPLSRQTAAAVHLLFGTAAFKASPFDTAAQTPHFAAAWTATGATLPPTWVSPDSPLGLNVERARDVEPPPTEPWAAPAGGRAWVDGREDAGRSVGRPAVVQREDGDGLHTWYLAPNTGLPAPPPAPPGPSPAVGASPPDAPRGRGTTNAAIGTGAAALGSGAGALATWLRARAQLDSQGYAEPSLATTHRVLWGTHAATSVATLTLGIVAWRQRR